MDWSVGFCVQDITLGDYVQLGSEQCEAEVKGPGWRGCRCTLMCYIFKFEFNLQMINDHFIMNYQFDFVIESYINLNFRRR